jgi:hypothetical protein
MNPSSTFNEKSRRLDEIASIAGEFIAISRSIAGELIDQDDNTTGYLGFSCGVVDAMSHQAGFDVRDTKEVLNRYLSRVFIGDDQKVKNTLAIVAEIPGDIGWSHSIEVGGKTALQFLASKNGFPPAACFALSKMLQAATAGP